MLKIVNTLGDVKTGVQGEAVYQGKYGQQIRRTRQPKRAIPSEKQLEHRQLYREALAWRKALPLANRRYLEGYCIANWIVDDYKIPLPWSRFALKLYLEHIHFVIVKKPKLVSYPVPELEIEQQTLYNVEQAMYAGSLLKIGQRLTIANRKVVKLGFWLRKTGSPTGNVTFEIRRVSNDTLIVSQIWGDASSLTTAITYQELEFTSPPVINEEVRILACYSGGNASNYVLVSSKDTDVKPNEYRTVYLGTTWYNHTAADTAYKYTFYDWTYGGGGIDWTKTYLGLLHVRHPALLSGEHRRDGKLLATWTNLSNLDDEYLTGQVGIDVFSADTIKFTTLAGIQASFRVP